MADYIVIAYIQLLDWSSISCYFMNNLLWIPVYRTREGKGDEREAGVSTEALKGKERLCSKRWIESVFGE